MSLELNNAALEELLAQANALPDQIDIAEEIAEYTDKLAEQDEIIGQLTYAVATKASVVPVLEETTVKSNKSQQVITPDEGIDGFNSVTVEPVTLQEKSVSPSASSQSVTPDSSYDGLSKVTVNAVDNLSAENIKKDVVVGGVTGSYEGAPVNGIIENYTLASSETINAGDFLGYQQSEFGTPADINTNANTGSDMSVVMLSKNKALVVYSYGSSYYLYASICTISGSTFTVSSTKALSTSAYSGYHVAVGKLDDNRVFITHTYSSSYHLYGMICTINGDTITVESDTAISTSSSYHGAKVLVLSPNKVVAVRCYNYSGYATACTISGNTITKGSEKSYASGDGQGDIHKVNDTTYIRTGGGYAQLFTVSDSNVITSGGYVEKIINKHDEYEYLTSVIMNNNYIVELFVGGQDYLGSVMYKIDGNTITASEESVGYGIGYSYYLSATRLTPSTILATCGYKGSASSSYMNLKHMIIGVNSNGVTSLINSATETSSTEWLHSSSDCVDGVAFVAFTSGTSKALKGMIINNYAGKLTSNIIGIAKTSGVGGDTIEVVVP